MEIKNQILNLTDEMIDNLARLVSVNSVRSEALPGKPFGEGPAKALETGLAIARELGFTTVNLDNYCGYAEMGEGEEIIGIAGHLDIVPAGNDWQHDPFALTREDGKVFGRGTTDDKGPVLEGLYAMKLLRDSGVRLNKRIRLIMGTDEECGSGCMAYYNKVAEPLTYGFTPDANYPCIHGEKGHMSLLVHSKNTQILSMNGGFVTNAVCDSCITQIPAVIDLDVLNASLASTALQTYSVKERDGIITISAKGIAAHASTPTLGVNAAGCTMTALAAAGFEDPFVTFYNEHIGTACDGSGCGLKCEDAYGNLTFNNGIVKTENGKIMCTIDIRTPVTITETELRKMCEKHLEDDNGRIEILGIGPSLFYSPESNLVKALYSAYTQVTGDHQNKPMVIGGGTYAKHLTNVIAFGPEKPGMDYHIHSADEFAPISEMQEAVEVYYYALKNLLSL